MEGRFGKSSLLAEALGATAIQCRACPLTPSAGLERMAPTQGLGA